ncbi:hypothetical protein Patl1_06946 [Pistacia atlantica]|uniref:Uncharacterized protein n=1 Tax=Pistacia atlantica TaxID=434234 RepID=A0ACC1AFD6_9ROSI|nr:hypothetical protein Patl1_06946 [Pistacia atlantica]
MNFLALSLNTKNSFKFSIFLFYFIYKFKAVSFRGSNIEPTAWEDKKYRGESRFLAQHLKKLCCILKRNAKNTFLFTLFSFVCVKKRVRK